MTTDPKMPEKCLGSEVEVLEGTSNTRLLGLAHLYICVARMVGLQLEAFALWHGKTKKCVKNNRAAPNNTPF